MVWRAGKLIPGWLRMRCSDAHRLLSEGMDRPIEPGERFRLRLHVIVCDACSKFERQIDLLRVAIRRLGS